MSTESPLEKYLYTQASLKGVPISGTFELTSVCNLDCKICYVKKSMSEVVQQGGLRSADEWIALGKRAAEAGMLFLLLTGGEPFLFPEFERVYTSLHQLGLTIDINSNGTMIGEEQIAWLKEQPPRHVKISLYGASEASYQSLCGSGAAFHKVLKAFELLKKNGIIVYSSITVTPHNYDELDEMLKVCDAYGVPVKATSYIFPPVRSNLQHKHENYRLAPEQAAYATYKIAKHSNEPEAFAERAREYAAEEYQNFMQHLCTDGECGKMPCRGGNCTFWINWQGEMLPCAMMDMGHYPVMGDHSFTEAWEETKAMINRIYLSSECSNCIAKGACYACAGSAYCETGSPSVRPAYPCEMTAHYLKFMKEEALKEH